MDITSLVASVKSFFYASKTEDCSEDKITSVAQSVISKSSEKIEEKKIPNRDFCDIEALKHLAKNVGGNVQRLVDTLEKTGNLTCEHFMPWKDQYHEGGTDYIDGVRPQDLDLPVKWGVDPWSRVYVGLRYTASGKEGEEQAAAVFQRYTVGTLITSGNHYGCDFSRMGSCGDILSKNVEQLISYGEVTPDKWDKDVKLTLSKS